MNDLVRFMRLAARLAVRGHGHVEPNPMVGCVVLDRDGAMVGWGYHRKIGGAHAEVEALKRAGAKARGFSHRDIVSGAAHDAVYMARIAPTAMVFVPCEGGISHNEIENARQDDVAAGCNVLLDAMLAAAGRA